MVVKEKEHDVPSSVVVVVSVQIVLPVAENPWTVVNFDGGAMVGVPRRIPDVQVFDVHHSSNDTFGFSARIGSAEGGVGILAPGGGAAAQILAGGPLGGSAALAAAVLLSGRTGEDVVAG